MNCGPTIPPGPWDWRCQRPGRWVGVVSLQFHNHGGYQVENGVYLQVQSFLSFRVYLSTSMITGEKVVSTDLEAKTVQVLDDTIQNICHLPPVQRHIKRYELLID